MNNLTPYQRSGGLFSLMDSLERSFFNDSVGGFAQFRCDISEKDGKYLLEAELPGFDAQDINVDVDGDTLTISAQQSTQNDEQDDEGNYIRRERRFGSYSRSFDISGIDADGITANYDNGVLNVSLPQAKETQPETRQIAVNTGKAEQQASMPQQGQQGGQPQQQEPQKAATKPGQSIADQQAEYSGPAKEQAQQVAQNNEPSEYAGGSESDYAN